MHHTPDNGNQYERKAPKKHQTRRPCTGCGGLMLTFAAHYGCFRPNYASVYIYNQL